jgi:hypothetical protein
MPASYSNGAQNWQTTNEELHYNAWCKDMQIYAREPNAVMHVCTLHNISTDIWHPR